MHPAVLFAVQYGPQIAGYLLAHREELGDGWERVARPVTDALGGTARIDRVGASLVAVRGEQAEVIGLLHRHTGTLDHLTAAVDGVWAGQQAVGRSLDLLTALSAVGLGASVLSNAALQFQLSAISRRLDRLAADLRQVKAMMQSEYRGRLTAGLTMLKDGVDVAAADPRRADGLYTQAAADLTRSSANYAEQLRDAVTAADPAYPWVVARHLVVSALGQAAAHLRVAGHHPAAVRAIIAALDPLRRHAKAVFARTVGADPAAFLMPALAEHGVTLEAMAELYRQAAAAGVTDGAAVATAADLFERLRGRMPSASDPLFYKTSKVNRLRAAFGEAAAAVEEVNRLRGLELAIDAYHTSDRSYDALADDLLRQAEATRPADGTVLAFFPSKAG